METRGGRDALGFYALGALAVCAERVPEHWARARIPEVSVIYIRVVAVRQDRQGRGIGAALVVDALRKRLAISDRMGAAAVALDVLRDDRLARRWAFYEKLGFQTLNDPHSPSPVHPHGGR